MKVNEFIEKHEDDLYFCVESEEVINDKWRHFHWVVTIGFREGEDWSYGEFDFYGGMGVSKPELLDVLNSLISDRVFSEMGFEEFLFELGYAESPDSLREGFRVWESIQANNVKLNRLFGVMFAELEESDD